MPKALGFKDMDLCQESPNSMYFLLVAGEEYVQLFVLPVAVLLLFIELLENRREWGNGSL